MKSAEKLIGRLLSVTRASARYAARSRQFQASGCSRAIDYCGLDGSSFVPLSINTSIILHGLVHYFAADLNRLLLSLLLLNCFPCGTFFFSLLRSQHFVVIW
jgi:hypothetical protein